MPKTDLLAKKWVKPFFSFSIGPSEFYNIKERLESYMTGLDWQVSVDKKGSSSGKHDVRISPKLEYLKPEEFLEIKNLIIGLVLNIHYKFVYPEYHRDDPKVPSPTIQRFYSYSELQKEWLYVIQIGYFYLEMKLRDIILFEEESPKVAFELLYEHSLHDLYETYIEIVGKIFAKDDQRKEALSVSSILEESGMRKISPKNHKLKFNY